MPRRSTRATARPPSAQSRSYSDEYDEVRSSMRYGSASSTTAAGRSSGSQSRAARHVPSASGIQARRCSKPCSIARILGSALGSPFVDLRLTDDQAALREQAARLQPRAAAVARGGSRVAPPGPPVGRRLAPGDRSPRARRLDRPAVAGRARRPGPRPPRRRPRGGGVRLPLAPAVALPPVCEDHRGSARAVRKQRAAAAAPPLDRARRAGVLPGVLGAGRGKRPGIAPNARRRRRRPFRRRRPQDLDVERTPRRLDLPCRPHRP